MKFIPLTMFDHHLVEILVMFIGTTNDFKRFKNSLNKLNVSLLVNKDGSNGVQTIRNISKYIFPSNFAISF